MRSELGRLQVGVGNFRLAHGSVLWTQLAPLQLEAGFVAGGYAYGPFVRLGAAFSLVSTENYKVRTVAQIGRNLWVPAGNPWWAGFAPGVAVDATWWAQRTWGIYASAGVEGFASGATPIQLIWPSITLGVGIALRRD